MDKKIEFCNGLKDGIPIALGYFAVSFSFGILAIKGGLSTLAAALTSFTNLTSAGQFAGLQIIIAGGTIAEIILTQFIINLRYALMSLSLTQKLDKSVSLGQRFIIAFGNTDEIFAVAMGHFKDVTFLYMIGLELLPLIGWTGGTVAGAIACDLLPKSVCSALSLALYGMFVAIVIPAAKKSRPVMVVVFMAAVLSCVLYYVPFLQFISKGIGIIICTIIAAAIGAILFPLKQPDNETEGKA